MTVPVYDLLNAILKRVIDNKNSFKPDKNYLHNLLQLNGFGDRVILIIILIFGFCMIILGYTIYYYFDSFFALITYIFFFIPYFIITSHLKYNTSINE